MDEVDPRIIHDCIKTYPIEDLKLTDEVYQSANHRPQDRPTVGLLNACTCTTGSVERLSTYDRP